MKRSTLVSLVLGGFITLWASAPAEAVVITDVKVVIGADNYTAASVGWSFPVTLLQGQDLVLTQNNGGYSFDTSDRVGPLVPEIHVTADGKTTVFKDLAQILNVKGIDTLTTFDNEAQEYGFALKGKGYQLFLGYADNTHTGACGAWASSIGLNGAGTCLPTPFFGATFFQGTGAFMPAGLVQTEPFHCDGTGQIANCYEGGVLRILAVPEPATMALLLTGAALIGVRRYRLRRPN
jgi:hypothetical protein